MPNEPVLLHIIPQQMWHDEAVIVGTREALLALRDVIDRAVNTGVAAMGAMPTDGEGYWLSVACVTSQEMESVPLGYAAEEAQDNRQFPAAIGDRITAAIQQLIKDREAGGA